MPPVFDERKVTRMAQFLAIFLAVLLTSLISPPATPATDPAAVLERLNDGGYTGKWTAIEPWGIEFCLPDGWTGEYINPLGVENYKASSADGQATLSIQSTGRLDDGQSLAEWAEAIAEGRPVEMSEANGQEAAVIRAGEITLIFVTCGVDIYCFHATGIPDEMALQIAGTCTDVW